MSERLVPRVVFDSNVVLSVVLFRDGRLAWLRSHWAEKWCVPLLTRATASELTRILSYSKFRLTIDQQLELQSLYLPYCETIEVDEHCPVLCRDPKDQIFLDLAVSGKADVLVSGDQDLLVLQGQTPFAIITPDEYRNTIAAKGR